MEGFFDESELENALKHADEDEVVQKNAAMANQNPNAETSQVADMEILNKIYDHYPPEEAFQKVPPPPYPIETHPLLWTQWVNENYMRGFGLMATSLEYVHCQYHELDDKLEKAEQRIKDLEGQLKLAMKERDDAKLRELEANTANEALQAERDYLAQKLDAVTNYFAK